MSCLIHVYCRPTLYSLTDDLLHAEVHICCERVTGEIHEQIMTVGSPAVKSTRLLVTAMLEKERPEFIWLVDGKQVQYAQVVMGTCLRSLTKGCTVVINTRDFLRRENLFPSMPLMQMSERCCRTAQVCLNKASCLRDIVCHVRLHDYISGLAKVCNLQYQSVVDKGIRHRCESMIAHFGGRVPCKRFVNGTHSVQGGHVIDPEKVCSQSGFQRCADPDSNTNIPSAPNTSLCVQALVQTPVTVLDFASLYPSIIRSQRIGKEYNLPDVVAKLMEVRCISHLTVFDDQSCAYVHDITVTKRHLQMRRTEHDQALSSACKIMANAMYGQIASPSSKFFDERMANQITSEGRRYLQLLVAYSTSRGARVVYGDTDSCMITFTDCTNLDSVCQKAKDIAVAFNTTIPSPMRVAVQDTYSRMLMLTKKRYIGQRQDGTLHYVGTLNVRSDTPKAVRRSFEIIAGAIMAGNPVDRVRALLKRECDAFQSCNVEEMVIARKVNKVDSGHPHAEMATMEMFRENGIEIQAGDTVEFVASKPRLAGDCCCTATTHASSCDLDVRVYATMLQRAVDPMLDIITHD